MIWCFIRPLFDFLLIHTSMVRSFPFFFFTRSIHWYPVLCIVCLCVWAQKFYLWNHFEKVWTSLNRIDGRLWQTSSDRSSKSAPRKIQSCFCLFVAYSFCFRFFLNEVKMRKTIVHAKLANSRKRRRWKERKNKRMEEIGVLCMWCGWKKSKRK